MYVQSQNPRWLGLRVTASAICLRRSFHEFEQCGRAVNTGYVQRVSHDVTRR